MSSLRFAGEIAFFSLPRQEMQYERAVKESWEAPSMLDYPTYKDYVERKSELQTKSFNERHAPKTT
jgi:hypothetical protein